MEEEAWSVIDDLVATRRRIVEVLFEIDHIRLQVNPQILARYAGSVGYLENDLLKWQLRARRLRRKLALVRAAANRGERLSDEEANKTLDAEFQAWDQELSQRMAQLADRLETLTGSKTLSPSQSRELKRLHRTLVKRLHPDLHPYLSSEDRRFFAIAQSAYESGDLDALRAVATATYHLDQPLDAVAGDVSVDLAMAEAQLNVLREQLQTLKTSHPYTLLELLDDPGELARVQHGLEERIAQQKQVAAAYEETIEQLRKGGAQ